VRIAVAGGTGVVGRHVVARLQELGHEPVVLARSTGVDLTTGAGLTGRLDGATAVVDVTSVETLSRRRAQRFFGAVTAHLLAEELRVGVRHHVLLSIVGTDRSGLGYHRAKVAQEQQVSSGPVPWTVLRSTQFHEFAGQVLERSPGPVAVVPRMRVQPVAAVEVARELADLAVRVAQGRVPDLAGPEVHELVELARRSSGRRVVGLPLPGAAGRAVAGGALLPDDSARLSSVRFDDWLAAFR
jgi:uncharacterized protein YbjT (DUF2867 family)